MTQPQRAEGHGDEPEHTHPPVIHVHDHYHVTHRHGGLMKEWSHDTFWHTHEHNHNTLVHSHDYDVADEEQQHDREAHIHDHSAPSEMGAAR
ncbi:MAG TPA: hypothetical protein VJQ83_03860 [Tepidiformaceae bacterium]|nr:hypothetical protein [Tepidiformaceae bacterium]